MRCFSRPPGLHRPRRKHSSACGHTPCRKPVQEVQQGTYQPAAGRFKSENLDGASPYSPQPQELPAWTKSLARIFVLDETRVPGSESFRMGRSVTPRGWSGRSSRMSSGGKVVPRSDRFRQGGRLSALARRASGPLPSGASRSLPGDGGTGDPALDLGADVPRQARTRRLRAPPLRPRLHTRTCTRPRQHRGRSSSGDPRSGPAPRSSRRHSHHTTARAPLGPRGLPPVVGCAVIGHWD